MRNYLLPCIALALIAVPAHATIIVDGWNVKFSPLAMVGPAQTDDDSESFSLAAFDGNDLTKFDSPEKLIPLDNADQNLHLDPLGNDAFGTASGLTDGLGMTGMQAANNPSKEEAEFCLGVLPEPASIVVWGLLGAGCAGGAMASRRRRRAPWSNEARQSIHQIIERGRISSQV